MNKPDSAPNLFDLDEILSINNLDASVAAIKQIAEVVLKGLGSFVSDISELTR